MSAPELQNLATQPAQAADGWLFGQRHTASVFVLLSLLMVFDFADRMVIAALLPDIKAQWHITDAQSGLLNSVLTLGMIVFAFPLAIAIDHWSRVKTASLMGGVWSIAAALGGLTANFGQLLATRGLVGIGEAGYAPAAYSWITAAFPRRHRQFAMGLFTASAPIGMAVGVALGGYIATHYGWRHAFGIVALPGLVIAALLYKGRDYRNADVQYLSAQNSPLPAEAEVISGWRGRILRTPSLLLAFFQSAMGMLQWVPVFYFLPTYFSRIHGLPLQKASLLTSSLMLLPIIGAPLGGWIMDRLTSREQRAKLLFAVVAGSLCTGLYLVGFTVASTWQAQYAVFVVAIFLGSTASTTSLSMAQELVHPRARAFSGTCSVVASALLGSLPGPFVTGLLSDHFGLKVALTSVTLVSGTLALIATALALRFYPRDLARVSHFQVVPLPA